MRIAAQGGVERGETVVADPVEVGAVVEEALRGGALTAVARTPEGIGDLAARHWPNATASTSGLPPLITDPGASMSAPASTSASSTSTSSLLAAQCSGRSAWAPPNGASEIRSLKADSYRLRGKDLDTRIGAKPAEIA
jgi:hypothetical protein